MDDCGNITSSNNTANVTTPSISMPFYLTVVISLINIVIFMVGVMGNISVVLVVCRVPTMRSPINYCFFSLSISDILVLVVCQLAALVEFYANDKWLLGSFICRISLFLENATNYSSILTVMAISFERYIAICKPLSARSSLTHSNAIKLIVIIWLIAYTISLPFVFITSLVRTRHVDGTCVDICISPVHEPWREAYVILTVIVFFVIPLLKLSVLYAFIFRTTMNDDSLMKHQPVSGRESKQCQRNKSSVRQAVYILLAVIILFFVCMLPSRVIIMWNIYTPVSYKRSLGIEAITAILWFGRIMLYINSAGNPIIYNILSARFRKAFRQALNIGSTGRLDVNAYDRTKTTHSDYDVPNYNKIPMKIYENECYPTGNDIRNVSERHQCNL